MTEEGRNKIIDGCAAQLAEHFDTVNIIVTYRDGSATAACARGKGNWFGRYGSTRDWIDRQEQDGRSRIDHGVRREMDDQQESA